MAELSKNLIIAREPENVWDRRRSAFHYDSERWGMVVSGSAMAVIGARRRGLAGGLIAALGTTLALRAAMGRHDYRVARHWVMDALRTRGWAGKDIVDDCAAESFPASDSPSWTADIGSARR